MPSFREIRASRAINSAQKLANQERYDAALGKAAEARKLFDEFPKGSTQRRGLTYCSIVEGEVALRKGNIEGGLNAYGRAEELLGVDEFNTEDLGRCKLN